MIRVRPAFPYYGAKGRIAPRIVELIPPHRCYVEPFAGSAAVLLAKPRAVHEVLNDVDANVITFYRVIRERRDELVAALELTPYARDEYLAARLDEPGIDDVERARRFLIRVGQSFNALGTKASKGWAPASGSNLGQSRAQTFRAYVERIDGVADRLRDVTIDNRDALDVLEPFLGVPDAVIYADPPYLAATRTSGTDYAHDLSTEAGHRELAEALTGAAATVILSGYASELYDELYDGWHRIDVETVATTGAGRGGRGVELRAATEVIWTNRLTAADLTLWA